ncbi:MAG: sulfur carrier protein [Sphingobacteriales bacterium]|jgi:sulfur carrier protein
MQLEVNGKNLDFPENSTLFEVLKSMDLDNKPGIAVALNNKVVSKSAWAESKISSGDKILCINATQGG